MIEFIDKDDGFDLLIDGKIATSAPISSRVKSIIITKDHEISRALASHKISELDFILAVYLTNWCEWTPFNNYVFTSDLHINPKKLNLIFTFEPNLVDWKYPFTFNEYFSFFKELFIKHSKFQVEIDDYDDESRSFEIIFSLVNNNEPLVNLIVPCEMSIRECYFNVIDSLNLGAKTNIFETKFTFPEKIKISCNQYLLYFAQFLQDLGINATSNLKEESGKVLFSVTPTDNVEALDKIREALAVYLKLPESPIVYDDSFAAMRLQQQIENLQHSQKMAVREIQVNEKLLLAQSDVIREKNVTISQQQTVIENQNKIIDKISSKSIMMDSIENKEELEEIYEGIKVGESKTLKEQLGIHLNPAKVIKTAVKNTFGKDDGKKSVLGLDEET